MRTVLVTGGTGALGSEVTRRFLAAEDQVAVTWIDERRRESVEAEAERSGGRLFPIKCDVTDPKAVASAVQSIEDRFGHIQVLAHLVGGWDGGKSVQYHSIDAWKTMIELNLISAFICCKAVLPSMIEANWGRIIVVSARAARTDRSKQVAYAAAKAAVSVLAEAIAEETKGTGVTANIVAPSVLNTEANRKAMPDADHSLWVLPESVAEAIYFLSSEAAGQLRGVWLPVFGSS